MINLSKRLRTERLEFSYTFQFGIISGSVEGEYCTQKPDVVFNLKNLNAQYVSHTTNKVLAFDQVYGQCSLDFTGALFSGSSSESAALFSLSCRGQEAVVFDGHTWLESSWNPAQWLVHPVRQSPPPSAKTGKESARLLLPILSVQSA